MPSRRCWSRPWLDASIARCVDALARQGREILVKLHRIGRGEAGVAQEARRDDAERAHARGLEAERLPDVAHEMHGRGLAVGAGDGGDGGGLQAGEGSGHQRHAAARIGGAHDDDGGVERRQFRVEGGEDRHRAAPDRVGDERARRPGAEPGKGREQEAGLDLARVRE